MTDSLTVFGTDFTNVTGIKATGTGNGTLTYIRPQGTKSISANGSGIDVTEYAEVDVAVPAPSPSLQSKSKSYTPTTSQQSETVSADTGYDGLSSVSVTVAAMPSGSVTAPSTISGSSATVSTGTNTLTLSKTVSVTPNVTTAGYVSSGTAGNSSVSLSASVTTQGSQTLYPSTSDQTITGSKYLTGTQTFKAVTTTNLTADNIKSGVTVQVGDSSDSDRVASVTGTYSGGGGSWTVKQTTWTPGNSTTVSHTFSSLSGTPKAAILRCTAQLTRSSSNTYYYIADIIWDGTDAWGNYHLRSNGSLNNVAKDAASGFNVSTGTNSITFSSDASSRSAAPGSFYNGEYELTYWY